MRHRHLDVQPDTPAAALPTAALDDLLERGDLDDWAPILIEIRRHPEGELARRVRALVDRQPMYGTSPLVRSWIDSLRAGRERQPHAGQALRSLRLARGLTQRELGARLSMTQPEISKLERRRDIRLSTARSYIAALGGELTLVARFGEDEAVLE